MMEFQERGLSYILKNNYSILGLDPGLGKSRIAIEMREKLGGNLLIVCPSYLVNNWVVEIRKWAPEDRIITAIKKGTDIYDLIDSDYAVISYDLAQKAEYFFEWCDWLVIDEGHELKNQAAKRTQFMHKAIFENSIERVVIATGTPIKNRVEEFYSLLAICNYDPRVAESEFLGRFPSSIDFADYFSYREEYTIEINGRFVTIRKWRGLRRVDELKKYLKGHYIRIKSEDVLDLPPIVYKDFIISNAPDLELLKAFNSYFSDDSRTGSDPTAKAQAALKKAAFTIKYAEDLLEQTDCVLIYSDHIEASEAIAKHFKVPALNGKMTSDKRIAWAQKFQAGEGRVLVATIGGLSMGVTLTRANNLILNDYSWIPGNIKQVTMRIQRMSQTKRCFVHRMIGSPQDKYIMGVCEDKMKVIALAT